MFHKSSALVPVNDRLARHFADVYTGHRISKYGNGIAVALPLWDMTAVLRASVHLFDRLPVGLWSSVRFRNSVAI